MTLFGFDVRRADMDNAASRSGPRNSLRLRQKALTSELIMMAVRSILEKGELADVTIASVAKTADVTERTVYRHYTTRDQLLSAFLRWHLERSGGAEVQAPRSLDTFMTVARRVYQSWQDDEGVVRALYLSPKGRQARRAPTVERIARTRVLADNELPHLSETQKTGLAVAITALALSENYILMRDFLEMDAEAMGETMSAAVDMMLAGARAMAETPKDE